MPSYTVSVRDIGGDDEWAPERLTLAAAVLCAAAQVRSGRYVVELYEWPGEPPTQHCIQRLVRGRPMFTARAESPEHIWGTTVDFLVCP